MPSAVMCHIVGYHIQDFVNDTAEPLHELWLSLLELVNHCLISSELFVFYFTVGLLKKKNGLSICIRMLEFWEYI